MPYAADFSIDQFTGVPAVVRESWALRVVPHIGFIRDIERDLERRVRESLGN